jgi:hypothetical protein
MAQRDQIYINTGVISPDEVRTIRLGLDVDKSNPVPRLFVAGTTVMPVIDVLAQSKANIDQVEGKQTTDSKIEDNEPIDTKGTKEVTEKATKDFFISPVRKRKNN